VNGLRWTVQGERFTLNGLWWTVLITDSGVGSWLRCRSYGEALLDDRVRPIELINFW
jgi:hypothetical protein